MLKLLKWNFIDYFKRNYWIIAALFGSLLLAVLPKNGMGIVNNLLISLSALGGFIAFQAAILSAIILTYSWLRAPVNQLEFSLPFPGWVQVTSKLLAAALVNFIACILMLQLYVFLNRFSGGSLQLFSAENFSGVPGLVLFLTFTDATIMLSFIAARSFQFTRRTTVITTALISLVILIMVTTLIVILMSAAGQVILPEVSNEAILTLSGTLQIMSTAIPVWVCIIAICLEIAVGSVLLGRRFQAD
jgi:hypothetical protein